MSFYIDHFVSARVAKFTYGTEYNIRYDPTRPQHLKRSHNKTKNLEGKELLPDAYSTILTKVEIVSLWCIISLTKTEGLPSRRDKRVQAKVLLQGS